VPRGAAAVRILTPVTVPLTGQQYRIEAGPYRATVTELGAGLRELLFRDEPVILGHEADELPAAGAGQLLVPWPNRIDGGRYTFGGAEFQLALTEPSRGNAIHGLTRWTAWTAVSHDAGSVLLRSVPHGWQGYPFGLEIEAGFRLHPDSGLHVVITARNRGSRAAPYGTGSHPYLTVRTASVDDCELSLPAASWLPVDDRGIPCGPPAAVEGTPYDFRRPRTIGTTRLDHPLTGLDRDDHGRAWAHLSADGGAGARVSLWAGEGYRWLQVFTGDPLGPGRRRRALAVEPMTCPPNAFVTGDDLLILQPGETVTHTWGIQASLRTLRRRPVLAGGDPGQVGRSVDVVGAAGVAALDQGDKAGTGPQERPGPLIAGGRRDHLGPVLAGQEHRIARLPVVGSHRHGSAVAIGGDQAGDRLRSDQRLVGQGHDDRADAGAGVGVGVGVGESLQGGAQRGAHAGPPCGIVDSTRPVELDRGGAGDDQDRICPAGPQQVHPPFGEGPPAELHQRFGLAEPGAFPRGEQDPRDRGAHGV
jgi:aldose 1-epimerase